MPDLYTQRLFRHQQRDSKQDKDYYYKIKEIPKDEVVVRTNHGVWLPDAGYQKKDDDKEQTLSRISSESRRLIARYVVKNSKNPEEILDGLTLNYTDNGQLNALRTTHKKKKMRTTSQILIIPSERTMYVRPVQSNMIFNFWKLSYSSLFKFLQTFIKRCHYFRTRFSEQDEEKC